MPTVVFTETLPWASTINRSEVIEPFSPVITDLAISSACSGVTSETIVIASPATTLAPRAASNRSITIESVSTTSIEPNRLLASKLPAVVFTETLSWASISNRSAVIEPFSPVITDLAISSACSRVRSETIVIASTAVTVAPRAASRRSI